MKIKPTTHPGGVLLEVNRRDEDLLSGAARGPLELKQILVPIDFSDCSKKALQYALPLAKQHGAALTLAYVMPRVPYSAGEYDAVGYAALGIELRSAREEDLAVFAAQEIRGDVPTKTVVPWGEPTREIVKLAQSLPADLIVISTHGRTGLTHVFLGSVAEHVVRHAPCPVLVVRVREPEFLASPGVTPSESIAAPQPTT